MEFLFEVVVGLEVVWKFGYSVGDDIVIGYGGGEVLFVEYG